MGTKLSEKSENSPEDRIVDAEDLKQQGDDQAGTETGGGFDGHVAVETGGEVVEFRIVDMVEGHFQLAGMVAASRSNKTMVRIMKKVLVKTLPRLARTLAVRRMAAPGST